MAKFRVIASPNVGDPIPPYRQIGYEFRGWRTASDLIVEFVAHGRVRFHSRNNVKQIEAGYKGEMRQHEIETIGTEVLGKILKVEFGKHPDNGEIGLLFTLKLEIGNVDGFRIVDMNDLRLMLEAAHCDHVSQLKDVPVKATVMNGILKYWRILSEVL